MKKRRLIAFALATLFLGATIGVFAAESFSQTTNGSAVTAPDGRTVGANDVSGTYVPD
jgi:hypothetical protein